MLFKCFRTVFLVCLSVSTVLISCAPVDDGTTTTTTSGSGTTTSTSTTTTTVKPSIVFGGYTDYFQTKAYIWADGVEIEQTNASGDACVKNVFLADDVYAVGYATRSASSACYWVNNSQVFFSSNLNGANYSRAFDISISGTDIFAGGDCWDGANYNLCVWFNDTQTSLTNVYGTINAVAIDGSDRYAAGTIGSSSFYPLIWKNNAGSVLPTVSGQGQVYDMIVTNGIVYVCGNDKQMITVACYWTNGVEIPLSAPYYAAAYGIALGDSGVVVAGSRMDSAIMIWNACYWLDGSLTMLTNPAGTNNYSQGTVAFYHGGDLYIGGYYNDGSGYRPCYWKNGQFNPLPSSDSYDTYIIR